jgi:hypothetical protein
MRDETMEALKGRNNHHSSHTPRLFGMVVTSHSKLSPY